MKSLSDAKAHIKEMAQELDQLDADIFVLQEVEDCGALAAVKQQMRTGSQYKVFFVQGKDYATGEIFFCFFVLYGFVCFF